MRARARGHQRVAGCIDTMLHLGSTEQTGEVQRGLVWDAREDRDVRVVTQSPKAVHVATDWLNDILIGAELRASKRGWCARETRVVSEESVVTHGAIIAIRDEHHRQQ